MIHRRTLLTFILLALIMTVASACVTRSANEDPAPTPNQSAPNPFEPNDPNTVILGQISHGFAYPQLDENGDILPLEYHGSELIIDYQVTASGTAKNVGFLLFVDGMPQPYKLNSSDSEYRYMHILQLQEDDQPTPFSFVFTPVTGKAGDTLHVSIASVYNPSFIPDMKETTSYGGYQTTLETGRPLILYKEPEPRPNDLLQPKALISQVRLSTEPITNELLERHSSFQTVDMEVLDQQVFSELIVDGSIREDHYQVEDNGTLHVAFNIFGHPGVRYRNTFYINHQAIASSEGSTFETTLTKGNVAVIEANIDLSQLEDFNTFYVISVPVNAEDFPDDVIILQKTPSLLLYRAE